MDNSFEILVSGSFDRFHLAVEWSDEKRRTSPEIERLIEEAWQARLAEARQQGKSLYPGRLCRLVEHRVEGDTLHLALAPTDYRELVGTNLSHPELARTVGQDCLSNALGVHALVRSAEGTLVLFKRSHSVGECPNFYDVCGGHVEPDFDFIGDRPDPFAAIAREMKEELKVEAHQIERIVCLGLVRNTATFKPDLVFFAQTSCTSAADLLNAPLGDEHADVLVIEDEVRVIGKFLKLHRDNMAPAGKASLTLRTLTQTAM